MMEFQSERHPRAERGGAVAHCQHCPSPAILTAMRRQLPTHPIALDLLDEQEAEAILVHCEEHLEES